MKKSYNRAAMAFFYGLAAAAISLASRCFLPAHGCKPALAARQTAEFQKFTLKTTTKASHIGQMLLPHHKGQGMSYLTGLVFACAIALTWMGTNVNRGYGWTDRFCSGDTAALCQNPQLALAIAVFCLLIALYRYVAR